MDVDRAVLARHRPLRFLDAPATLEDGDEIRVGAWMKAWRGKGAEPPQLVLPGGPGAWIIYDSGGVGVEHPLGAGGPRALEAIGTRARRVSEVAKETAAEVGLDVEKEMAELRAKGRVFQEGDRFLSLVFMGGERA